MAAEAAERRKMTASEYLAWEREQRDRHRFDRGEVFAMAGGSPRHNALVANVTAELRSAVRRAGCLLFSADQRIGIARGEKYVYADATVVCGPVSIESGTTDVLENPTMLVEVLSPRTEAYDRGEKWAGYRRIDSLRDYILVSQDVARIEHYRRAADDSWHYEVVEAGGRLTLSNGCSLALDAVFEGVMELAAGA